MLFHYPTLPLRLGLDHLIIVPPPDTTLCNFYEELLWRNHTYEHFMLFMLTEKSRIAIWLQGPPLCKHSYVCDGKGRRVSGNIVGIVWGLIFSLRTSNVVTMFLELRKKPLLLESHVQT